MSLPSKAARRSVEEIRAAAINALAKLPDSEEPLFGDDEIAVDITHHVEDHTCTVKVWSMGPRPKVKRTGRKRDLQNCSEGILDGLQGLAFVNDNQVSLLHMKRAIGKQARWVKCEHCQEFWCRHCDMHAYECECESVENMKFDPYTEPGP